MNHDQLTCLAAILAFVAGAVGWICGRRAGARAMLPCEQCGTVVQRRHHMGLAESWVCCDRDGCVARQDRR